MRVARLHRRRTDPRPKRRGKRFAGCLRRAPVAALLTCALIGPATPAEGQERTPSPSAQELWETYPLQPSGDPAPTVAPTASATPSRRVSAPAVAADTGAGTLVPALLVVLVLAAGVLAVALALRDRRGRRHDLPAPSPPASGPPAEPSGAAKKALAFAHVAPLPQARETVERKPFAQRPPARTPAARRTAALTPAARKRDARGAGSGDPAAHGRPAATPLRAGVDARGSRGPLEGAALPPDPRASWSAEVIWVKTDDGARFRVRARTGEREEAVVGESPPLKWPPASSEAVQAMTLAVTELERALLAAGWTSLEGGKEWYARRFAWRPAADPAPGPAPGAPAAGTAPVVPPSPAQYHRDHRGRFMRRSAWLEQTRQQWRCEIVWTASAGKSRFAALAYAPGERSGRPLRDPAAGSWLGTADTPAGDEEQRGELLRLTTALEAAGWEGVGRGAKWYSARFVWRASEEPPHSIGSAAPGAPAAGLPTSPATASPEEEKWKDHQNA